METQLQTTQTSVFTGRAELVARAFVLAIALLLLSRNVTSLFAGHHEMNNAIFSIFARNHVEYGLGYTRMFCVWDERPLPPDEQQRYLNHPPLLPVWVAIPMLVFGDHEWVGRLVPIVATLGAVWLLMVIMSRLHSPTLGLLSGFFYVTLPITAYFGRMLGHEPPCQFFSLLMLHGYLQWAGLYPDGHRRKVGALYYTLGAVLGIGTGWASLIMVGLIWLWQLCRTFANRPSRWLLLWVTVIPAASLVAVIVHILWGCQWDASLFGPLLLSRTLGRETLPWASWFSLNWGYLMRNVSGFGICAAVIYLMLIPAVLHFTAQDSAFRQVVRSGASMIPVLLLALQGLLWVFVFKHQSWIHDYWQYFTTPFFAVALAGVLLATFTLLSKWAARAAIWIALLLIAAPMPFFACTLDLFHYTLEKSPIQLIALEQLTEFVPPRVPVMTSMQFPQSSESFGNYTHRHPDPQFAYYAHRPLIYSTDISEIEANRQGCAAYIMQLTNDPNLQQLAQQLDAKYDLVWSWQGYLIFLIPAQPDVE
jgi:hypothetical protein